MQNTLMQANHQWMTRRPDERFTSLDALYDHCADRMNHSKSYNVSSREIRFEPNSDNKGISIVGPNNTFAPTHWAFGQACALVDAPADYMRSMPSPLVADHLNYRYQFMRDISEVGLLLYQNGGAPSVDAMTGPKYGRIWNAEYTGAMRDMFKDSAWHIPQPFNGTGPVTQEHTTLYAGDRDAWVFLCDGGSDVELPNRRHGQTGRFQRGFFTWNSEVGGRSLGLGTFLFDYMCCNHIIWGVSGFEEIRIRHTVTAPDKWLQEVLPALQEYARSSTQGIKDALVIAKAKRIADFSEDFFAKRFGPRMFQRMQTTHELEESRPIESVFDVVTAATAVARQMPFIGPRVDLEREAGALLKIAA